MDNDYYPWWYSPKTPPTIIYGGTHPKHQQLLSMEALTQNTNDYWVPPWIIVVDVLGEFNHG
jgi:hypothetical protein